MAKTPEQIAQDLVSSMRDALGDRIECAILYGSAARNEYVPAVSDVNVMLLLDDIDTAMLSTAAPVASRWIREGHTPPLILERRQWQRAADVFAIELADMKDAHRALYGADCVAGETIRLADLRSQAERELRGKLLQLQTGMLMAASTPDSMGDLLKKALPSFTTYLRASLRLAARDVPATTPAVIREGLGLVGAKPDAWLAVWEARTQRKPLKLGLKDSIVAEYHSAAERTAEYVDTMREVGG